MKKRLLLLLALSLALSVLATLVDDLRLREVMTTFNLLLDIIRVILSLFA